MAQDPVKHSVILEDGRRADKLVREELSPSGESKTITELYTEPVIEKKLSKRVVEYKKPVVVQREFETVDENGEVVERKVESVEPAVKMELREHISTQNSVNALSVQEGSNECDCYVTKEEMQETFKEGLLTVVKYMQNKDEVQEPNYKVSALQAMTGEKLASEGNLWDNYGSYVMYGGLAVALAIFCFFAFYYNG